MPFMLRTSYIQHKCSLMQIFSLFNCSVNPPIFPVANLQYPIGFEITNILSQWIKKSWKFHSIYPTISCATRCTHSARSSLQDFHISHADRMNLGVSFYWNWFDCLELLILNAGGYIVRPWLSITYTVTMDLIIFCCFYNIRFSFVISNLIQYWNFVLQPYLPSVKAILLLLLLFYYRFPFFSTKLLAYRLYACKCGAKSVFQWNCQQKYFCG